jgi:hypothetical protein
LTMLEVVKAPTFAHHMRRAEKKRSSELVSHCGIRVEQQNVFAGSHTHTHTHTNTHTHSLNAHTAGQEAGKGGRPGEAGQEEGRQRVRRNWSTGGEEYNLPCRGALVHVGDEASKRRKGWGPLTHVVRRGPCPTAAR